MECSSCGRKIISSDGEEFCENCGLKPIENSEIDSWTRSSELDSVLEDSALDSELSEGLVEIENIKEELGQSERVADTAQVLLRLLISDNALPDKDISVQAVVCSNISVESLDAESTRTELVKTSSSNIKVETLESLSDRVIDQLGLEV